MRDWRKVQGPSIGPKQREFLVQLALEVCERFEYPVIVNIGVHVGCSMYCLHAGCPDAWLFGIDKVEKYLTPTMEEIATLIHGDSNVVHDQVEMGIHLLFIDGDHSYGIVKGDIDGWVPKLEIGGIVAFHDLHMGGVIQAFEEWWEAVQDSWEEVGGNPLPGLRAFRRLQ